jgi:hypothetical protein
MASGQSWFSQRMVLVGCAAALLSLAGFTQADDAQAQPAGLRVFYTGHSFHMFVPPRVEQLVKSAGIEGHKLAGTQGIGGSRVVQHWELADEKNKAKPALMTGEVDVFTMAAHLQLPDAGIENFTELGLKHNPKLRLLVQASWMPYDLTTSQTRLRENAERDATNLADLQTATDVWRKNMEAQVDELNQRHGRPVIFIVPVGDAVNELRRQIAAEKFPGVTKPSELFRDPIGHGLGHIQALAAYCNFAAIYHRSPEGLKLDEPGVTAEQHAILQRIAWETVSKYPPAGVKRAE